MTGFLIMIACCTALAAFSQKRTDSLRQHHSKAKEHICFYALTCYMIIFAGLRVNYNDTGGYIHAFYKAPILQDAISTIDWTISKHPGFRVYESIIKVFTDNTNLYIMITSAIVLGINLWFIRKYTSNLTLSVLLFFAIGYYSFTMAAIKQTFATSIALIGFDKLINRKRISFAIAILIATLVHPYSLMYFIAPILMCQEPWKKGNWILIACVLAATYSFNFLQGTILDMTSLIGEDYDAKTFVGEGLNAIRVTIYWVPIFLSFFGRKMLYRNSTRVDNLFVNCSLICSLIMFIGLFGGANMFARMAMYFEPFIYISLPWMLQKLSARISGFILTTGSCVAYPMYFLYQNVIASDFDSEFVSISIWQFVETLMN